MNSFAHKNQLRQEWLDRLRAGDDKQIKDGNLETDEGVCAIGLAVRILQEYGFVKKLPDEMNYQDLNRVGRYFGLSARMVGLTIHLNDDQKLSFKQIADSVEDWAVVRPFKPRPPSGKEPPPYSNHMQKRKTTGPVVISEQGAGHVA
jgi:hypothetical protein